MRGDDTLFAACCARCSHFDLRHLQYLLGRVALLAQPAQAKRIVALRKPHSGMVAHQVAMIVGRNRQPEGPYQQQLSCGGFQKVAAAYHLADLHGRVIGDDGKLIGGHVISPPHHEVAEISSRDEPLQPLAQIAEGDSSPSGMRNRQFIPAGNS